VAGLLSLSQSALMQLGKADSLACLFEYDQNDNLTSSGYAFQYFPETITDTKAVNYSAKDIPGGSLPLYQWVSSGERVVSFTAYFTSDIDMAAVAPSGPGGPIDQFNTLVAQGLQTRNLDVRTAFLLLRRYMFPTYVTGGTAPGQPLTYSPPKLMLMFTGSGLGLFGGFGTTPGQQGTSYLPQGGSSSAPPPVGIGDRDGMTCVMTQCDLTIEQTFPSGMIRVGSVQLAFAHIAQLGGVVTFPSYGTTGTALAYRGDNSSISYYPIKVQWNPGSVGVFQGTGGR
jgi:hypothetical protein